MASSKRPPGGFGRQEPPRISREALDPLHEQVHRYLRSAIENGDLKPGMRLPKEKDYADWLGTSVAPVRQAILDLVTEGYLVRTPGRGTFVRPPKSTEKLAILEDYVESALAQGRRVTGNVLELRREPTPEHAARLRANGYRQVVRLVRVLNVDDEPALAIDACFPARLFAGMEKHPERLRGSVFQIFERQYGVILNAAENVLEVIASNKEQAEMLAVPRGSPLLRVETHAFDASERLMAVVIVLYRVDRARFRIHSHRFPQGIYHTLGTGAITTDDTEQE